MMNMGYRLHLIDLLAKLYRKQVAKVKVAGTLSEWFRVKKGVRQGRVLSPYLFNILAEMVMRETLDGFQGGLQIGGRMITNLRYADDIILLATSEAELQELVDTPMPSSDVSDIGQCGLARPMYVDVPRPLNLTSSSAVDVAHPYAPPSVDVDVARPAYGLTLPLVDVGPSSVDVPRPSSVDVRRPMPYMGVRQPSEGS